MSRSIKKGDVICSKTVTDVLSGGDRVFWWAKATDSKGERVVLQILNPEVSDEKQAAELRAYFTDLQTKPTGGGSRHIQCPVHTLYDGEYRCVAIYPDADVQPLREIRKAQEYWEEAMEGLKALHLRDLVHGALSLDRFVVDRKRDSLLLKEFGYAPLLRNGMKGAVKDCSSCLAPEVVSKGNLTKEADIYGLAKSLAAWDPRIVEEDWYKRATHQDPARRFDTIRAMIPEVRKTLTRLEEDPKPCRLTVTVDPKEGGDVRGGGEHPQGAQVEITATPRPGWLFERWSGDVTGSRRVATVALEDNREVTAHFQRDAPPPPRTSTLRPMLNLGVDVDRACRGGGEVSVRKAGEITRSRVFAEDTTIEIVATAKPFWRFDHWSGDRSGTDNPVTVEMVDGDKTITAHFVEVPHAFLSGTCKPRRTGAVEGEGSHPKGSTVDVRAVPAPGWSFERWSGALSGTDNPAKLTLDGNKSVVAHFARSGPSGPEEVHPRKRWGTALLWACGSPWTVVPFLLGFTGLAVLWTLEIESREAFLGSVAFLLAAAGTLLTQLIVADTSTEE